MVLLTAEEVVKSQFGSSRITRAKETGAIISLAEDLKAAATDSQKKRQPTWSRASSLDLVDSSPIDNQIITSGCKGV